MKKLLLATSLSLISASALSATTMYLDDGTTAYCNMHYMKESREKPFNLASDHSVIIVNDTEKDNIYNIEYANYLSMTPPIYNKIARKEFTVEVKQGAIYASELDTAKDKQVTINKGRGHYPTYAVTVISLGGKELARCKDESTLKVVN